LRLHNITLRNFRGVEENSVEFADNGITVVEGDNGTGKTSMMQALDLIFRYPDSSKAKQIEEIKPEGKDLGAEVALTATLGPYKLTYEKKYHRNTSTRLEVHTPRHELLTGRDAHDRAEEIFETNVDVPLFRALWLHQGIELAQADLGTPTSLGAALDQTSYEFANSESETSLFQRVIEEYERYFTGRGQQKIEFRRLIEDYESAQKNVQDLEAQLSVLNEKINLVISGSQRINELQDEQEPQAQRVKTISTRWQEIESLKQRVESIRLRAEIAVANREKAQSEDEVRCRLVKAVVTAIKQREEAVAKLEELSPAITAAQASFDSVRNKRDKYKRAFDKEQTQLRLRQTDFEYQRDEFDRQLMIERQKRIPDALAALRKADSFLSTCQIDSDKLVEIEAAHTTALTTRAQLEGESAHVEIEALTTAQIEIDAERHDLSSGEQLSRIVEKELILEVKDLLRISVTASQGSESLADAAQMAEGDLRQRLSQAGAKDVDEARRLDRQRAEAEVSKESSQKALDNDLRDLKPEQLSDKIDELTVKTAKYLSNRTSDESLPEDLSAAKTLRDAAEADADMAKTTVERAARDFEGAEKRLTDAKKNETEATIYLRLAVERLDEANSAIGDARTTETDEAIIERIQKLNVIAEAASGSHHEAESQLEESNPEGVAAELETARQVLEKLGKQVTVQEDQLRDAKAYLSVKGEEGLHDELDEAKTWMEHTRRARESEETRATAAKKLFETMDRHRYTARSRYLAPFRKKIESLGKIVFGPDFSVELDNDLRIAKANVTGVSMRFSKHSTGEREQLGMIARLACASIVSDSGGVPLILDDALGATDPGRLKTLGAALTVGARECQVIALTCVPGRYQHVGAEKVVTIF
jgi:DNA repair exonuclease SbcCD ATPase subunit